MTLRPELQALAAAGATCLISGKVIDMRRDGDDRFLLLKRCSVRQWQRGEVYDRYPDTQTDHLWIRVPAEALEERKPCSSLPGEMYKASARPAVTMWMQIQLIGRCGFYTTQGHLGIGITEVIPAISEERLTAYCYEALQCFKRHPWRRNCYQQLIESIDHTIKRLTSDMPILLSTPLPEVIACLQRVRDKSTRDHRAEIKAAEGTLRSSGHSIFQTPPIQLAKAGTVEEEMRGSIALNDQFSRASLNLTPAIRHKPKPAKGFR